MFYFNWNSHKKPTVNTINTFPRNIKSIKKLLCRDDKGNKTPGISLLQEIPVYNYFNKILNSYNYHN